MTQAAPFAEIWRGPFLESVHSGHAVVWCLARAPDQQQLATRLRMLSPPICDSAIDCVQFFVELVVFEQDLCQQK